MRALLLAPLLLLALAGCGRPGAADFHGTLLEPPMPAAEFALASAEGPVRAEDLSGRLVVLTFGYTSCPDVCPATMARLARAVSLLGKDAGEVQVAFVSVDPERDTPERVARYAAAFDERFLGLSGTPEQVADAAGALGAFFEKAEGQSEAGYLVDHTATVFVLDREGRARLIWSYGTEAEAMAEDLRLLVKHV